MWTKEIDQGMKVQEALTCLLCNRRGELLYQNLQDHLFGTPGTWSLLSCLQCGVIWLSPCPLAAEIHKLYERYYTHPTTDCVPRTGIPKKIWNGVVAARFGYKTAASGWLDEILGNVFSRIGPMKEIVELDIMSLKGPPKGKLLEIGCGNGQFLARMRELGWETIGVEPDGQAVKVARERGLTIYEGSLEEACYDHDTYDAITLSHVIEHLRNPIDTLRECRRVLKPGGRIVVTTPNIHSLGHRLFKELWRGLEVPRHFYLFSSSSLRACAERAGLQVLELRTLARSAHKIWTASRLIQGNNSLSSKPTKKFFLRFEGLVFQAIEYAFFLRSSRGEELQLIATK